MGQTYYFLNYAKNNQLEDKCPKCGEEFIPHKGGVQCQLSKCRYKQREEKHRTITPLMVNSCLKNNASAYTPSDVGITDDNFDWGWSFDYSRSVYIPWYTLRSKKEFFDTVAHETGHILAYEKKFTTSIERKTLEKYYKTIEEYENLPPLIKYSQVRKNYEKAINNYYWKNKRIIDIYEENQRKSPTGWTHGERYFYPAYKECFNSLLATYSIYNYNNSSSPKSWEEVRDYEPKKNKG